MTKTARLRSLDSVMCLKEQSLFIVSIPVAVAWAFWNGPPWVWRTPVRGEPRSGSAPRN